MFQGRNVPGRLWQARLHGGPAAPGPGSRPGNAGGPAGRAAPPSVGRARPRAPGSAPRVLDPETRPGAQACGHPPASPPTPAPRSPGLGGLGCRPFCRELGFGKPLPGPPRRVRGVPQGEGCFLTGRGASRSRGSRKLSNSTSLVTRAVRGDSRRSMSAVSLLGRCVGRSASLRSSPPWGGARGGHMPALGNGGRRKLGCAELGYQADPGSLSPEGPKGVSATLQLEEPGPEARPGCRAALAASGGKGGDGGPLPGRGRIRVGDKPHQRRGAAPGPPAPCRRRPVAPRPELPWAGRPPAPEAGVQAPSIACSGTLPSRAAAARLCDRQPSPSGLSALGDPLNKELSARRPPGF